MRQHLLLFACFSIFSVLTLQAQTGCPGCAANLPAGLPADTLFLQNLPDGEEGKYYDQDISFRMPKTTTPVHAIDSTTPPGFAITSIEIVSIEGLPPGLYWQPNQFVFETATQTDGCVKFCGKPTQSDTFVMTVKVRATIFVFTQEASFPLRIYIAPDVSTTEGFSITHFAGCGGTTASFTNNIPSGGQVGFSYEWDFGDGTTFLGENPPPHAYNTPGIYSIKYHAKVDTAGFVLESVKFLELDCGDNFSGPDLYFFIYDPDGQEVYNSQPDVKDISLPYTFPLNLPLGSGTYVLAAWEEDSGLKGTDDPCGSIPFNFLSNDTLTVGGLKVVFNISHEVKEINSTDTVFVYPQPATPVIFAPNGLTECIGEDSLLLVASTGTGIQWRRNGQAIAGAVDSLYKPEENGYYQVEVTTADGCSAISDSAWVEIYPLPAQPVYANINNSLRLEDTLALPAEYALQWYDGSNPIPGATGFRYCATENGNYGLLVTDLATGCINFYASTIVYDPDYDCTVGTGEAPVAALGVFPNPANGWVTVRWNKPLPQGGMLRIWDAAGRLVETMTIPEGVDSQYFTCSEWNAGFFTLEVLADGWRGLGKLAVIK